MSHRLAWRRMCRMTAVLAVLAGLLGCDPGASPGPGAGPTSGPEGTGPGDTARSGGTTRKVRIGVAIPAATHGWTGGINWWARKAIELHPGIDWQLQAASGVDEQVRQVEDMLTRGVDGLVILCMESAPLTPVGRKARERGVYLVSVDRGFTEPIADVFLEGDNKAFGRIAARYMAQRMKGKGNLVVLEGIPSTVNTDRVTAFGEVMAAHPGVTVLDSQPANWNRQKGLEVMQNMLTRFPTIDAVWAGDDDVALGALQAITESGRQNQMFVVGGAGMQQIIQKIHRGDPLITATVTYPPSMIAAGIHLAASNLRDGKRDDVARFMPRHMVIDVDLITRDNAQQFLVPGAVY